MLRERNKENKMVQRYKLPTEKNNNKHYDRADANPFLYTQREGIGTAKKEEKKKRNGPDNVLVFVMPPSVL